MSRYLERAEHTARLGDVCLGLTLDRSSDTVRRLMGAVGTPPKGYGVAIDAASKTPRRRCGCNKTIEACVAAARENARQVREQISTEMWEQLNRLYLNVSRSRAARGSAFYTHVKEAAHLFQGVTDSTMIHTEGWHYIQIGRSIERAAATATMLEMHFDDTRRRGPRRRHRRVRVVDGAASVVLGVRGVLPALHRRRPARAGRRVPAAERRLSAIGALCRSTPSKRRCARSRGRSGGARRAASIGSPAACARRSTTARSTRSWPTACRATCRAFAGSASTCTRRCIRPTSATRRRPRSRHERRTCSTSIRHTSRFTYSAPISESMMEVRMQPRSDGRQRCLRFELTTQPRARVFAYQDSLGNVVHHFDIPSRHSRLWVDGRCRRRDGAGAGGSGEPARHGMGRPRRDRRDRRALAQPAVQPVRARDAAARRARRRAAAGSAMPIR